MLFAVVCEKLIDTRDEHARACLKFIVNGTRKIAVNPEGRKYSKMKDVLHLLVLSEVLLYKILT